MVSVVAKYITDEVELITAFDIREAVFVQEQKVPRVDEFDEFEDDSFHFLATINNKAVGAARYRKTPNGIKLERFAVLSAHRGRGVGKALVSVVLDHIKQAGTSGKLYLHAQLDAVPLYSHFGFKIVGEQFSECDIEHRLMELVR